MGIFFEKVNRKSAMPVVIIRVLLALTMATLMIVGFVNGFQTSYLVPVFILAAVSSVIDGMERLYRNEKRKLSTLDFSLATVYGILALTFYL